METSLTDQQLSLETKIQTYFDNQTCPKSVNDLIKHLRMGVNLKIPVILRSLVNDGILVKVFDSGEDSLYVSQVVLNKPQDPAEYDKGIVHDAAYTAFIDILAKKKEQKYLEEAERVRLETLAREERGRFAKKVNAIEQAYDDIKPPSFPGFTRMTDTVKFVSLKDQVSVIVNIAAISSAALKPVNLLVQALQAEGIKYSGPVKYVEAKSIVAGILSSYSKFVEPVVDVYSKASVEAALSFVTELERWVEHQSIAAGRLTKTFKNKDSVGEYEASLTPKWVYAEASTSFEKQWKVDVREKYVGL